MSNHEKLKQLVRELLNEWGHQYGRLKEATGDSPRLEFVKEKIEALDAEIKE